MQSKDKMENEKLMERGWQAMEMRLDKELPQLSKYDGIAKLGFALLMSLFCFCSTHEHVLSSQVPEVTNIASVENTPTNSPSQQVTDEEVTLLANNIAGSRQAIEEPKLATQTQPLLSKSTPTIVSALSHDDKPKQVVTYHTKTSPINQLSENKYPVARPVEPKTSVLPMFSNNITLDKLSLPAEIQQKTSYLQNKITKQFLMPMEEDGLIDKKSRWICYAGLGGLYSQERSQVGSRFNIGLTQYINANKWSIVYELGFQNFGNRSVDQLRNDADASAVLFEGESNATSSSEDNYKTLYSNYIKQNQIIVSLLPHYSISSRLSFGFGPTSLYLTDDSKSTFSLALQSRINYRLNNQLSLNTFWQKSISDLPRSISQYGLTLNYNFF